MLVTIDRQCGYARGEHIELLVEILPLHLRVSEGPSRIEYQHRLDIKAARGRIQVDRTEPLSLDDYVL
jgi:hypothetical protein